MVNKDAYKGYQGHSDVTR